VLSQESDEIEMYDEPEHALEADEVESTEAKTTFLPPPVSPAVEAKANPFRVQESFGFNFFPKCN